jgi:hypothetical protein
MTHQRLQPTFRGFGPCGFRFFTTMFTLVTKVTQGARVARIAQQLRLILRPFTFSIPLISRVTLLVGIAVVTPVSAQTAEFQLKPRLCLHAPHQACELLLNISWQQPVNACLFKKATPTPLLCGNGSAQQLTIALAEHTQFELRSQQDGQLLGSRLVRVLQVDLNAGDQLLKRSRASWGNP